MGKGKVSIIAAIILRVCILIMIGYVSVLSTKMVILAGRNIQTDSMTSADALAALKDISFVWSGIIFYAVVIVIALVCSIIAFKKTSVASSVIRTVFLAVLALCSVRSAIIFTAIENCPEPLDESYKTFVLGTMMLGGKVCIAGFFILSFFVPVLLVTSIIAIIRLVRDPHRGEKIEEDGGWNV
ncbi:MAG: hypothetical protein J6U23_13540 [Clostridiales bacterium]|nr:hypothetical protein [Clostridiales bacterium]